MANTSHDVTDTNVMGEINVTPMVDVMLVLLIIFMVVTPAIAAGFPAKLPLGVHLKAHDIKDSERTVLGIDVNGDYYLNRKRVAGCTFAERQTPAGKAACSARLLPAMQQDYARSGHKPDDHVLFLRADQARPYQDVLDALDLARKSGVAMVAAVSEQLPGVKAEVEKAAD